MTKQPLPTTPTFRGRRSLTIELAPLALLLAVGGTGCYRATGSSRPTVVAEQIPATGGDRVAGNKATAGEGDYYLGNDYMHLAVDGAVFGDRPGQFGAPSGGAILDIGGIALDQSFKRVSLPTDNLERLGPVANQDPDLPFVFDHYTPTSTTGEASLTMTGYLLDPKHKLGVPTDASGRVLGLVVEHTVTLPNGQRVIDLVTTVHNTGATTLPIQNIADYLHQSGGGFRFVVPAVMKADGVTPLPGTSAWGVEIPIGSDFSDPMNTSVLAPSVGLMGAEPSAATMDLHQSLTIRSLNNDLVLVASDPQLALEEDRPRFPSRLVVGSPLASPLPKDGSLTYSRRIYQDAGVSLAAQLPAQTTSTFNLATADWTKSASGRTYGVVGYSTGGSAVLRGPRQAEIRFERYDTTPSTPQWILERVEWREAGENYSNSPFATTAVLLPSVADTTLPGYNQQYRVTVRNRDLSDTASTFLNSNAAVTGVPTDLRPSTTPFVIAGNLSPERSLVISDSGALKDRLFFTQSFTVAFATPAGGVLNAYAPQRITFAGLNSAGGMDASKDPDVQRVRTLNGTFSQVLRAKVPVGPNLGAYQFAAGNQVFGSSFLAGESNAPFFFRPGSYLAFGTRGPLSGLGQVPVTVGQDASGYAHALLLFPAPVPAGWTSFDLPGPSQMSTGGMLPAEQLSSALAEGVQVVGRTELDRHTDANALASEFLQEFDTTAGRRQLIDGQLFTFQARSSVLGGSEATALFTPGPDANQPFGGARLSTGWTLADFIAQAEGQYTVVHRPEGPQGLFKKHGGIAAGVALGTGANAWWTAPDVKSAGKRTGDFDAIELLRGEYSDPAGTPLPLDAASNATAWFNEFLAARSDWFNLLGLQTPQEFTKALGLSSAKYSLDTPVGLARTYLKADTTTLSQSNLAPVLSALRSGAAVASTGPLLDVNLVNPPGTATAGPGELLSAASATLKISLYAPAWVPVQEVRIVVNGVVVQTLDPATFGPDPNPDPTKRDSRLHVTQFPLDFVALTGNKDAWVVVEAGVPLATSGAYAVGTPWNKVMKGIYPVAVTNPIFVDVNGSGYAPPALP